MEGWADFPFLNRPMKGRIDMEGTIFLSGKITHVEHEAVLKGMTLATATSGLPYKLAPGTCEECG